MLAVQWSDKPIDIELDCSFLVDAIKEKNRDRSSLTDIISEIRALVNGNRVIFIVKIDHT